MNEMCDNIAHSILNGRIPSVWIQHSYPCTKMLTEFVNDFKERFQFWKVKTL